MEVTHSKQRRAINILLLNIVFTIDLSIDLFPLPMKKEFISMKLKFYCFA